MQRIGELKLTAAQRFVEFGSRGVDEFDADPRVARAHAGDKLDQVLRCDGAHDPQLQLSLLQARELAGSLCGEASLLVDFVDVRLDDAAEFGEMGLVALSVEQRSSEFLFE